MAKNFDEELAKLIGSQTLMNLRLLVDNESLAERINILAKQLAEAQQPAEPEPEPVAVHKPDEPHPADLAPPKPRRTKRAR